ncbi:MAG: ATP-binding cassette domain-containing protein [Bacilli bacterium]
MENTITIRNLTKKYYDKKEPSLNNISLDIHTSQVVGIFGHDGSGKSTLLKILASLIPSFQGDVYIFGKPLSKETRRYCSYFCEDNNFPKKSSVKSIVNFYADFYKDFNQIIITSLLSKFHISFDSLYQDLNSRNKKLLMLCLTLSRESKIYLLDEPFKNEELPVDIREFIFSTIFETCSKDALIIITSSLVEDIEDSCDSVIFLDKGKVVLVAQRQQLIKEHDKSISLYFKEVITND